MNSEFFTSFVRHVRFIPKRYDFDYNFFWTKFDLDELQDLERSTWFFSRNSFNLVSFYDNDHIHLGFESTKENIQEFLKQNHIQDPIVKIELLTNPRILGYTFNPVSFYFIETTRNPFVIIEIGNTFKEQKPYLVHPDDKKNGEWIFSAPKYFYISPFASAENTMTFRIKRNEKSLQVHIDDFNQKGELEIKTTYAGNAIPFNSRNLVKLCLLYPFITLRIIWAIHYHALRLFLKKIPYFKKNDQINLQRDLFVWRGDKFIKK